LKRGSIDCARAYRLLKVEEFWRRGLLGGLFSVRLRPSLGVAIGVFPETVQMQTTTVIAQRLLLVASHLAAFTSQAAIARATVLKAPGMEGARDMIHAGDGLDETGDLKVLEQQ
jgi:hypothetical protein